jgi:thiamine biosynthesis lipoprotein ApbE
MSRKTRETEVELREEIRAIARKNNLNRFFIVSDREFAVLTELGQDMTKYRKLSSIMRLNRTAKPEHVRDIIPRVIKQIAENQEKGDPKPLL